MAEALEAGYDLGALALCFVALALLVVAKDLAEAIAAPLDFSVFGIHPLRFAKHAIEGTLIGALNSAIQGVERLAAKFESGLIDSMGLLIAIPALALLGTKAAIEYLWSSALKPTIRSITNPIRDDAAQALAEAETLAGKVATNVGAAERYAREHASAALADAKAYADRTVEARLAGVGRDIAAAIGEAEGYADQAVGRLRAAEDAAVSGAVALAAGAKLEAQRLAAAAIAEAEAAAGVALSAEDLALRQALAAAQAAGQTALAGLEGVVINVGDDLRAIEAGVGAAGIGALIAAIPQLATLVHAIATEAGLENADCRNKVKGVCGTDPLRWARLLEGLAAIGFGFNLAEIVEHAGGLAHGLGDLTGELVRVPEDVLDRAGEAIGELVAAIAA